MSDSKLLASTAYLPPISYFSAILNAEKIIFEAHETYIKQTYRNRCLILSANGPLPLIIPVIRPKGNHTPITEVEVDYSTRWNKNHVRAIESAYRSSAYFEFIADFLFPFYEKKFDTLWELNLSLINAIFEFLEIKKNIETTSHFVKETDKGTTDLRSLSPKQKSNSIFPESVPYYQVFEHKFGFTPNLSIIDMLFNEGLESLELLKRG
ncbi:WbqC family protein [Tenuifilum thalassicum]|uniref:WbqC family protein n=1 Tax=Tenuifilum thalassicum TaxID=2590900 RepID=A0A7D3Y580_9BACT|nr:WbqC family protein [Tenuifilum thalassicum]QKG80429.1 WbqC family protein [Tenuifilum thalassicum]